MCSINKNLNVFFLEQNKTIQTQHNISKQVLNRSNSAENVPLLNVKET